MRKNVEMEEELNIGEKEPESVAGVSMKHK